MIFILYVFLWLLKSKTKILSKWQTAQCHDHSFLNVKFISGSPMFPSLTLTIRLGKGVNVTLTVLWHILVQCILWSHYEICKRVIIMLYGIEKSMHIFPSVECNNYFNFFFLGNAQQVQLLCLLVFTAAREGAQQFIEIIFSSSAGRLVFDAYKNSQPLPEVVAKDHGHKKTACYLEGVTKRYMFWTI